MHSLSFPSSSTIFIFLIVSLSVILPAHLASAASCMKVIGSLGERWDSLAQAYQAEICSKGCQPVVADWDKWTYQYGFLPLVETLQKEMGLSSNFRDIFVKLGEEVAAVVKRDCGQLVDGQHFCAESDTMSQWNRCFKKNAAIATTKNSLKLLPLVTKELCRGERYAYLEKDDFWKQVIPGFMKAYARTCETTLTTDKQTITTETVKRAVSHGDL